MTCETCGIKLIHKSKFDKATSAGHSRRARAGSCEACYKRNLRGKFSICRDCGARLVRQKTWDRFTPEKQAEYEKSRKIAAGGNELCHSCAGDDFEGEHYSENEIALTGGRWVNRGGIKKWVPNAPKEHREITIDRDLADDHMHRRSFPERVVKLCAELCDCGCLKKPNEFCPACLAWAEKDAIRTSWKRVAA